MVPVHLDVRRGEHLARSSSPRACARDEHRLPRSQLVLHVVQHEAGRRRFAQARDVSGDGDVAAEVRGHDALEAQRLRKFLAGFRASEELHAILVRLGHGRDAVAQRDLARIVQLSIAFARKKGVQAPLVTALAFCIEDLHTVVVGVDDVQLARVPRQTVRLGEEARVRTEVAPCLHEVQVAVELHDAVVARIADVHAAGVIHGDVAGTQQLAVGMSMRSPRDRAPIGERETLHAVVARVGDVEEAVSDHDAARFAELSRRPTPRAEAPPFLALSRQLDHRIEARYEQARAACLDIGESLELAQRAHLHGSGRMQDERASLGIAGP